MGLLDRRPKLKVNFKVKVYRFRRPVRLAIRLNPRHAATTLARIQTSQLLNRLQKHVLGKVELSPTQVRAAEVLLKKTVPDLKSIDLNGTVNVTGDFTVKLGA